MDRREELELRDRLQKMQLEFAKQSQALQIGRATHNLTFAERMQRLAIDRIKLGMEIANHRVGIAEKFLNLNLRGEELINARLSRREWQSAVSAKKKEIVARKKRADRMYRWINAAEELIWGEQITSDRVSAAYRGVFSISKKIPAADQRELARLKPKKETKAVPDFFKPKTGKRSAVNKKWNSTFAKMKFAKSKGLTPAVGGNFETEVFEVLAAIDVAFAKMAASEVIAIEGVRTQLNELRTTHWKKHGIT